MKEKNRVGKLIKEQQKWKKYRNVDVRKNNSH